MSGKKSIGLGPLLALWLVAAGITGGWLWATSLGECSMVGAAGAACLTQTLLHGAAPMLGWVALGLAVLAAIATLVVGWRRLAARRES